MTLSLIITVRNEAAHLPRLFESIARQTHQPDEVVICDAGSTDGTVAVIEQQGLLYPALPVRVISAAGANIARGRNLAIAAAQHDVIAVTDAGVWLDANWLAELIQPLLENPTLQLSAGFFVPDCTTPFEIAMGATVLPALSEIDPAKFLPSSRSVAFRKSAWAAVQGYPEWLDFSEDIWFDLALKERFGKFGWAPQAVAHFRPRGSLSAFYRQYYNYASGDGRANLFLKRHLIRYGIYCVGLPLGLGLMVWQPALVIVFLTLGLAYCWQPLRRLPALWQNTHLWQKLYILALIPIIRCVGDVAKMIGYPVGIKKRIQANRSA